MTRVIKVGGRPQNNPLLVDALARAWRQSGGGIVLVHGGGDEVSALQKSLGSTAQFVNGRRVTTAQDMEIVRMALSGAANKRLVSALVTSGVGAVGISGEDAGLIAAVPMDAEQLGFVGTPQRINVAFLHHLLNGGYLPVVSPVSRDETATLGPALNVNGDDAAAALAVALGATELLLVADVPGVLRDGSVVPALTFEDIGQMLGDFTATGGMRAKLQAAATALDGGVDRVRISDLDAIADSDRGTTLMRAGVMT